MRLDIYQAETRHIAREQTAMLDEVVQRLESGHKLTRLEHNGILHALQILIENAIGKARHLLKHSREPVPVSAYEVFAAMRRIGKISDDEIDEWNAVIGLRNRIVHDYMNVDLDMVIEWVSARRYQFVTDFLMAPIEAD